MLFESELLTLAYGRWVGTFAVELVRLPLSEVRLPLSEVRLPLSEVRLPLS